MFNTLLDTYTWVW